MNIGFLDIRLLDILDILFVAILLYYLYQLVKGNIAFNIFIGILLVYLVAWLVRLADMKLLSGILNQFLSVGVLLLIILFQPEIRRFLLLIGKRMGLAQANVFRRILNKDNEDFFTKEESKEVLTAIQNLAKRREGSLIIFSPTLDSSNNFDSGVEINADISAPLLESIFWKNSPLHDGAVLINNLKIKAAGMVLPISHNGDLPSNLGLRHRAAVGVTEQTDAIAIVVSEETGNISYSREGRLYQNVQIEQIQKVLASSL